MKKQFLLVLSATILAVFLSSCGSEAYREKRKVMKEFETNIKKASSPTQLRDAYWNYSTEVNGKFLAVNQKETDKLDKLEEKIVSECVAKEKKLCGSSNGVDFLCSKRVKEEFLSELEKCSEADKYKQLKEDYSKLELCVGGFEEYVSATTHNNLSCVKNTKEEEAQLLDLNMKISELRLKLEKQFNGNGADDASESGDLSGNGESADDDWDL